jgi:protein SCO1/2
MDRRFREVQELVAKDQTLAGRVHLVSITFDPAYDTPAVLAAHAARVGANRQIWSFFTGDRSDVLGFAARFGATIVPDQASAPEIAHNLRTAVIDTRGRLVRILTGNDWTAEQLVTGLRSASGGR